MTKRSLLSTTICFFALLSLTHATVIYVPDNYSTIQDAIAAAAPGDVVLVRPGTYVENLDFLGKAITVKSDQGAGQTFIDGGNPVDPDRGSVVIFENGEGLDSILDGFTLCNGTGCGTYCDPSGGGILCYSSSPTIINNVITSNRADGAGGIYCRINASPMIAYNTITNNVSLQHSAGGILCEGDSSPKVFFNEITDNHAMNRDGGGMVLWYSAPEVAGNLIARNLAMGKGGGILCVGDINGTISGNVIIDNVANSGGGIDCDISASPEISGNIIRRNTAYCIGGGIFCYRQSNSPITNNVIAENWAGVEGGGIAIYASPTLRNNTFFDNSTPGIGGGVSCKYGDPTILNSIFWDNAAAEGAEIYLRYNVADPPTLAIRYSCVKGGAASIHVEAGCTLDVGAGMIADSPLFLAAEKGYYYLKQAATHSGVHNRCVDGGDPASPMIDGSTSLSGWQDSGIVDLGFHHAETNTLTVPNDHATIQGAIDSAADGSVVYVRPGTYAENIVFAGKKTWLVSEMGATDTIIDGMMNGSVVTFDGGEDADTILEGFTIQNGSGRDDFRGGGIYCEFSSPTITNNVIKDNDCVEGGGIWCWDSSMTIEQNLIEQNTVSLEGGGMFCILSSPVIRDNTFRANRSHGGGGISSVDSDPIITRNLITENHASMGGGLAMGAGSPQVTGNIITKNTGEWSGGGIDMGALNSGVIRRNIISQNAAPSNGIKGGMGGGIYFSVGFVELADNVIFNNTSADAGGGIYLGSLSSLRLINNTIASNSSSESGGGIYVRYGSDVEIRNTILWNDTSPFGKEIYLSEKYGYPSALAISHSDVGGGIGSVGFDPGCTLDVGPGMIDADPLFVDVGRGAFGLSWPSPCRGAGDNGAVAGDDDVDGDPRIAFGQVDIGADEYYYHLHCSGDVLPGAVVEFKIVGYPSAPVKLAWGQAVVDPAISTQHGDLFVWPLVWSGIVGDIPPDGILSVPVTISPNWNPGDKAPMQALVGPWGVPCAHLTNLLTVVVE